MKLPRLQLHLSTCIVLMFVAGGLVWANVAPKHRQHYFESGKLGRRTFIMDYDMYGYGWPVIMLYSSVDNVPQENPVAISNWHFGNLAINLATALAILAATAFACKWVIRRRRKKLDVSGSAPYSECGKCEDTAP